jgi:DNA-binding IscR family transcriptional regulator
MISRTTLWSAAILKHINEAGPEVWTPKSEICAQLPISFAAIEQLMRALKDAELVDSYRGVKGGYRIRAARITLGDLVRLNENPPDYSHMPPYLRKLAEDANERRITQLHQIIIV